jgi:integrase
VRGRGEGSYFKEGDAFCWRLKVRGSNIVRKAPTQAALRKKVKAALDELEKRGIVLEADQRELTTGAYMAQWLETFVKRSRANKTHRQYEQVTRCYIVPHIGKVKLRSLTTTHVQEMLNRMSDAGHEPGTVDLARRVLRRALNMAMNQKPPLLIHNPVTGTEKPKAGPKIVRAMTPEQMDAVLAECSRWRELKTRPGVRIRAHRYGPMIGVMLYTGVRISEAMGWMWLDWHPRSEPRPTLQVRRKLEWTAKGAWQFADLKRPKSRRDLPLTGQCMAFLEAQRRLQGEERAACRGYYTENGLIFTTETGQPVIERNVQRALDQIIASINAQLGPDRAAAHLPHFSLHDLRRSYGTRLANEGVPVHVLQHLMGHEDASTTMRYYMRSWSTDMASAVSVLEPKIAKKDLPGTCAAV